MPTKLLMDEQVAFALRQLEAAGNGVTRVAV